MSSDQSKPSSPSPTSPVSDDQSSLKPPECPQPSQSDPQASQPPSAPPQAHPYPPFPAAFPFLYAHPPPPPAGAEPHTDPNAPPGLPSLSYMFSYGHPGIAYTYPPPQPPPPNYPSFHPPSAQQPAQQSPSQAPQPSVTRAKRQQVKMACTNCAAACKKCEDARPCERCIKYNLADSCVNGVRKERKKGVKRGPYKRKEKPEKQEQQQSQAPQTPQQAPAQNGDGQWATPPPNGHNLATPPQFLTSPEGYYTPYWYPPHPGYLPHPPPTTPETHTPEGSAAAAANGHAPPQTYYPLHPAYPPFPLYPPGSYLPFPGHVHPLPSAAPSTSAPAASAPMSALAPPAASSSAQTASTFAPLAPVPESATVSEPAITPLVVAPLEVTEGKNVLAPGADVSNKSTVPYPGEHPKRKRKYNRTINGAAVAGEASSNVAVPTKKPRANGVVTHGIDTEKGSAPTSTNAGAVDVVSMPKSSTAQTVNGSVHPSPVVAAA